MTPSDPQKRALDHLVVSASTNTICATVYPQKKYTGNDINKTTVVPGTYLTHSKNMGDGIAFIFSYIYNEVPKNLGNITANTISYQYFTVAFIPKDYSRVEFRVPKNIPKKHLQKAILGTRNEFDAILKQGNIQLVRNQLNFYKAIGKIHKDV
ncbi:hypothetical protein H7719_004443, partial [Salmonella enterica subsp. enterica serovar Montevideo]|nr:hypothetical protein [Salmonella enterica subsp. enterica serovar Montevideo]